MPDIDTNVTVDVTGNTAAIATDYSTSGITNGHVQIVKMAWGPASSSSRVTTSTPLPVDIRTVTATLGITGSVGGLGNFRVLNGLSGAVSIPLVISGTTSGVYAPVQINGNVSGVTNGIPLTVTGGVNVRGNVYVQGVTGGIEIGITGGRRLNSSSDSVTVSGTVGITGGRYLLPGYDGVRVYGGNNGETMIPVTLRDGTGSSIGSSGGALNVNVVGAGITATVSVGAIVGICQANQAIPLFIAGATTGPAVRVKGLGAGDAVPVVWSTAMPVSVSGQVSVDLNAIYDSITGVQTQLDDIAIKCANIESIYNKVNNGVNTISQKPGQVYVGSLIINTPVTTFPDSTALYSGITIRSATSNSGRDVLIDGNGEGSGGYPLSSGQSIFIETNNLQNLSFSSSGIYPVTIHYIAS